MSSRELEREENCKYGWGEAGKLTVQTPEILFGSPNTPLFPVSGTIPEAGIQLADIYWT
jgi:hypothetical protein